MTGKSSKTIKKPIRKSAGQPLEEKKREYIDFSEKLKNLFSNNRKVFLWISMALTFVFSLLLFDVKVSIGGDDSEYIIKAFDFIKESVFPEFQGSLYPIFLSFFILVFGLKIILLKFLSLIFMLIAFYFFYKTIIDKFPDTVVIPLMLALSVNYYILSFSSLTYSEAFFMMLQSVFFWFISEKYTGDNDNNSLKVHIFTGLLVFFLIITRNIAFAVLPVVLAYCFLTGKWKSSLYISVSVLAFFFSFEFLKRFIWDISSSQISAQGSRFLYKDYFNPVAGKEDLMGFINRFIDNSEMYFSKLYYVIFGMNEAFSPVIVPLCWLFWMLIIGGFVLSFRQNRILMFLSIYVIFMSSVSFVVLQKYWGQPRIIMVYVPAILLIILYVIFQLSTWLKNNFLRYLYPVILILIFIFSIQNSLGKVKEQFPVLIHNIQGDQLYGYSNDWVNYINMSKWAAEHAQKGYQIGARKPEISFIHTGRKFFPIRYVPGISRDSLLKTMNDSFIYVGIPVIGFFNTSLFPDPAFRSHIISFIRTSLDFNNERADPKNNIIGIFKFKSSEYPEWEKQMKLTERPFNRDVVTWIKSLDPVKNDFGIYLPDELLGFLKKNNVKYLLLAQLRGEDPKVQNGVFINTLNVYLNMTVLKYNKLCTKLNSIGDEEPAELYELNLENPL